MILTEVNDLTSIIQREHEKIYLEQMLTTLLLTTLDDEAGVTNTAIATVKQNINSLVSTIIIIPYLYMYHRAGTSINNLSCCGSFPFSQCNIIILYSMLPWQPLFEPNFFGLKVATYYITLKAHTLKICTLMIFLLMCLLTMT